VGALGSADALVVHVDGKPAGVVTRQDVLGHLAGLAPGRTPTVRA
jgi:cystathionine beta-synthase